MRRRRVVIMGAAGRDFHNFNVVFRADRHYEVKAFTAAQIPDIEGRTYPRSLAGPLYPRGIRVYPESDLPRLIERLQIDEVVFSYSDVSFETVMAKATLANAHGADFRLLGAAQTMLAARVPVIAVVAARTGSGKSQTSRAVCAFLHRHGQRVVAVRHPMPYGDLARQAVQRFSSLDDLRKQKCTIEEMEEYEPHIGQGTVVYAGVDYGAILRAAEREADVIVWDGGNNDTSFYRPDLTLTVLDPHRAGHELTYYPGATNLRLADVVIVNKVDSARAEDVAQVVANVESVNPRATVLRAASPLTVDDPAVIRGRRVLADRGRAHRHPRRNEVRRGRTRRQALRRPRDRRPARPTPWGRWPAPSRSIRPRGRCFPPWATGRSRSRTSSAPSHACPATPSSSARPWTCAGSCVSTSPRPGSRMRSTCRRSPAWRSCSRPS